MSSPTAAATEPGFFARWLHWLFETSLVVKGTLASFEAAAGLVLALVPGTRLVAFAHWLVASEMVQDPGDPLANRLLEAAAGASLPTEHFQAWYIFAHGGLKLTMVLLLARPVMWAYPAAMALLAAFAAYEIHGALGRGSLTLSALAALDILMIALVWREWQRLDPKRPA